MKRKTILSHQELSQAAFNYAVERNKIPKGSKADVQIKLIQGELQAHITLKEK